MFMTGYIYIYVYDIKRHRIVIIDSAFLQYILKIGQDFGLYKKACIQVSKIRGG